MIIGLAAKKHSGKDTVADYIVEKYGFKKYGFGDPIKEIGRILFDFNDEQLYGSLKENIDKRWSIRPREFFQKFGTDYGQLIMPQHFPKAFKDIEVREFWVKKFWIWYESELEKNPLLNVVIPDVRFVHEYNFLISKGAYIFKIKRKQIHLDSHLSETELDKYMDDMFHAIIENDGTKEELFDTVRELIN